MRPTTEAELAEAVRAATTVRIAGSGSKARFGLPVEADAEIDMTAYTGVVWHEPADQVVVVRAGTRLEDLLAILAESRLCLPMPKALECGQAPAGFPGTVGGLVSMNLPHGLFAQCGGPRDWVLGMTVVRGDGTFAKSGSRVVKSVAGYDVHKLFIGARGTLGVVADVTFKTFPVRALPQPTCRAVAAFGDGDPIWVQRVAPSDYDAALTVAGDRLMAEDRASATLWARVEAGDALPRFPDDWVLRAGCGAENLVLPESARALQAATKAALDPAGKFNPGAMGAA